jgi:predicted MarR family transcription regulator
MNIDIIDELEHELAILNNTYINWIQHCINGAGLKGVGFLDIMNLGVLCHARGTKRLVDICCVLRTEEHHTVNYSVKKLIKKGYAQAEMKSRTVYYSATQKGLQAYDNFREYRLAHLIPQLDSVEEEVQEEGGNTTKVLQTLSEIYAQSARVSG